MDDKTMEEMHRMISEMYGQLVKSGFVDDTKSGLKDFQDFKLHRRETCPFMGESAKKNKQWWVAIIVSNIMTIGITWWRSHIG